MQWLSGVLETKASADCI